MTLRGACQCKPEFRDIGQGALILVVTPCLAREHRVVPKAAVVQKRGEPSLQTCRIHDQAVMHRTLEATGIRKAANRKSRRHPGHHAKKCLRVYPLTHEDQPWEW